MCKDNLMGKREKSSSSKEVTYSMKGGAPLAPWLNLKDKPLDFNTAVTDLARRIITLTNAITEYTNLYTTPPAPPTETEKGKVITAITTSIAELDASDITKNSARGAFTPALTDDPTPPGNTADQQEIYNYLKYAWYLYNTEFTSANAEFSR